MQEFVYNQFVTIFGSGLIEKTSDFINIVVGALNTLFPLNGNGIMNTACTLFSGLAGSLLIIYYFLDMYSLAAKDLVSLEKLTISFIKLILCFMLVLYAKEITVNLFNLCGNMYHMVAEETINKEISQNGTSTDKNNKKTDNGSLYDIKDIGSGLKELGLQIAFDAIWNKMIENRAKGKRTWIYIDEFYLLMTKETSAEYISTIWKRARKWNGVPTAITQNVEDMLKSEQARTVINNSHFVTLLQQSPVNRKQLSNLLGLTTEEQKYISTSKPGMGLLKIGEDVFPINDDFPKDTKLYGIMTTKPDELVEV